MLVRSLVVVVYLISFLLSAQVPEACIQSPSRSAICDHLIYKRSPVDVAALEIQKNQMICLCMADFQSLRVPIRKGIAATEQQVELARTARRLGISEDVLLSLVRD